MTRAELLFKLATDSVSLDRLIAEGLPVLADGSFAEASVMAWLRAHRRDVLPLLRMTRAA